MENKEDQKSDQHFMPCLNENCNTFHLVTKEELKELEENKNNLDVLLCDDCKSRKDNFHIIQCMSCRTIIDFLPILPGENAGIMYIEKCLRCGGTIEDEISFIDALYKQIYI